MAANEETKHMDTNTNCVNDIKQIFIIHFFSLLVSFVSNVMLWNNLLNNFNLNIKRSYNTIKVRILS